MNVDKNLNQAAAIRAVEDYDALPLAGPGRWAHIPGNLTLYTNDDNVLFVNGNRNSLEAMNLFQVMEKLRKAGKTASEAFDILRLDSNAISGDLSELA